jgi:hypothetical protein
MFASQGLARPHAHDIVNAEVRQRLSKFRTGRQDLPMLVEHQNLPAEGFKHRPNHGMIDDKRDLLGECIRWRAYGRSKIRVAHPSTADLMISIVHPVTPSQNWQAH